MDLPDCIEVCSFSTTSPSWIKSCLTLMPVISSNALASVFDSYSCVVRVSDTTEISLTPLAFNLAAVSMNHFISAACWSLDSVDGWNSLSIHFFAASETVVTGAGAGAVAAGGVVATGCSFFPQPDIISTTAPTADSAYIERFMGLPLGC